jgi:cell division protein ZapA
MGQVTVTIDGKSYRMACDDGQESHLEGLAADFDGRVQRLRSSFGEIGDMRLTVMAAITTTDEMMELRRKLSQAEEELIRHREAAATAKDDEFDRDRRTAEAVAALAERVERIAKGLARD